MRPLTSQELEFELQDLLPGENEDSSWESDSDSDLEDNLEVFIPSETEYCSSSSSDFECNEPSTSKKPKRIKIKLDKDNKHVYSFGSVYEALVGAARKMAHFEPSYQEPNWKYFKFGAAAGNTNPTGKEACHVSILSCQKTSNDNQSLSTLPTTILRWTSRTLLCVMQPADLKNILLLLKLIGEYVLLFDKKCLRLLLIIDIYINVCVFFRRKFDDG